jgi:uncharacterized protein
MGKITILLFVFFALSFNTVFASVNEIDCSILSIPELASLACSDHPDAQYELGLRYAQGLGVKQNYNTAIALYRKAADKGNALAEYTLGNYYFEGLVLHRNYTEAVKWWRLAALQDISLAQYKLGVCYANGHGVKQDYSEAIKWYRISADKGCAKAQLLLGNKYYDGKGVIQSDERAYFWYLLACANGDSKIYKDAFYNREIVVKLLTSEQIAYIQYESQNWLDRH